MKTILIWLTFSLLSLPPAFAQLVIGNGGEGVQFGDIVLLRDLYESDLQYRTYFGSEIHPAIQNAYREVPSLPLTEFQERLLKAKLSDIERMSPCLGLVLTRGLPFFHWSFESQSLDLFPQEPSWRRIPEYLRVQIANRTLDVIHIHQKSWDNMPDSHKVALIIHELLFSLVRPLVVNAESSQPLRAPKSESLTHLQKKQDVLFVRLAMKRFFEQPEITDVESFEYLLEFFTYPQSMRCESSPDLVFRIINPDKSIAFEMNASENSPEDPEQRDQMIRQACTHWSSARPSQTFEVDTRRWPFQLLQESYRSFSAKKLHLQYSLQAVEVPGRMIQKTSKISRNTEECGRHLRGILNYWFSPAYRSWPPEAGL